MSGLPEHNETLRHEQYRQPDPSGAHPMTAQATGRTALVTGGMGGLGEAIARALHDAGHTVIVVHSPGGPLSAYCAQRTRPWQFPVTPCVQVTRLRPPFFDS